LFFQILQKLTSGRPQTINVKLERKNNDISLLTADMHIFSGKKNFKVLLLERTEFELFPSVVCVQRTRIFFITLKLRKFQLQNKILFSLRCTELAGYKITHSLVTTNLRFYCVFRNELLPDLQWIIETLRSDDGKPSRRRSLQNFVKRRRNREGVHAWRPSCCGPRLQFACSHVDKWTSVVVAQLWF